MRAYEIIYVIRTDLPNDEHTKKVQRIHSLITENGGEIEDTNDWGKRNLAYEIRHCSEGHYGLSTFRLPPQGVKPLKERLNIDEEILRFQIVACDQ